ncbi:MAG: gliding motility-associated C-terminal domain-containing protein [Bacteroidia bacterium]
MDFIRRFAPVLLITFLVISKLPAQQSNRINWQTSPFNQIPFIENKGAFDAVPGLNDKVLYSLSGSGEYILFGKKGIYFVSREKEAKATPPGLHPAPERDQDKDKSAPAKFHIVSMTWGGSGSMNNLVPQEPCPDYYVFHNMDSLLPDTRCKAYRKLLCKNLYPGIDILFEFYPGKGLKYTLNLQAGADVNQVKMDYTGMDRISTDSEGNMRMDCRSGMITDHAPLSNDAVTGAKVESRFTLHGQEAGFFLGSYDASHPIVIDPWVMSPGFTTVNKGYDIATNPVTGDIFVYGGAPNYQLKKLSSSGAVIWTYVASSFRTTDDYYGDMTIDPTGNIYLADGCGSQTILKIDRNTGTTIWTSPALYVEPWRLLFDGLNNHLIIGGLINYTPGNNIALADPNSGNLLSSAAIIGTLNSAEIRSLNLSAAGSLYVLHVTGGLTPGPAGNFVSCNTTALTNNFYVPDGFTLEEQGAYYADNSTTLSYPRQSFHGFNGIATSANFIYCYDGGSLNSRTIGTGALVNSVVVNGGIIYQNSGIVVDSCGNVFVGTQNGISIYDPTLTFITSVPTSGAVFDLAYAGNGNIYACGNGFVTSANVHLPCGTTPNVLQLTTAQQSPVCANNCNGTASVTVTGGTAPYTYSWSPNTAATAAVNSLCPGTYTCTIKDAAGHTNVAYFSLTALSSFTVSSTQVNNRCHGDNTGVLSVSPSSSSSSYTFSWSPVAGSTPTMSGLAAGIYTCTITDGNGCSIHDTLTLIQPPALQISSVSDSICPGQSALISVSTSGGTAPYTYSWNNGAGNIPSQTVSPAVSTTYSCFVTDNNNCLLSVSASVNVRQTFVPVIASNSVNGLLALNALPGSAEFCLHLTGTTTGTYSWILQTGATSTLASPCFPLSDTGRYCVRVITTDSHGCSDSSSLCIHALLPSFLIPNVFSPNGDGSNDEFHITTFGYSNIHCIIYDRWGVQINTFDGLNGYWDGKSTQGHVVSDGTYYFVAELWQDSGNIIRKTGFVTLFR